MPKRFDEERAKWHRNRWMHLADREFKSLKLWVGQHWLSAAVHNNDLIDYWAEFLDELCEHDRIMKKYVAQEKNGKQS